MFENVMKVVTEAMAKQQESVNEAMAKQRESFAKMLEDRDTSQRRHETVEENVGTGPGIAEAIVVTEETLVTGNREKGKAKGCSFKGFLGCKPSEFRGTTEPATCLHWLQEVEMAFEASECDDSQRVRFASQLLKGEALAWWNLTRVALSPNVLARLPWA